MAQQHKQAAAKPAAFPGGLFVSFEGGEGSGKSTQIKLLAERLAQCGFAPVVTREPGGTKGAEALRHILLNAGEYHYPPLLEAVLFAAARRDHVEQVIAPALAAGQIVLCDRFIDSTRVYQGLAGKVSAADIGFLEQIAIAPLTPHISLFLDIDAETGMARAGRRRAKGEAADRFEKDDLKIQQQRRQAFLRIAEREKQRCHIIDASRPPNAVAADIWAHISARTGIGAQDAGNGDNAQDAAGGGAKPEDKKHGRA